MPINLKVQTNNIQSLTITIRSVPIPTTRTISICTNTEQLITINDLSQQEHVQLENVINSKQRYIICLSNTVLPYMRGVQ